VSLRRQIRRNARELLAAIATIALGLLVAFMILSQQHYNWPWEDFYEVKAEFSTAQAVKPGQGQAVTVSGVKVGDIKAVELEDGQAVVTLEIEKRYAPIYRDATMLLRPRTGLKDMQVALDPGTPESGEVPDGGTLPQSHTQPDVNPDEVWAALDADTRRYLAAAVDALGTGLEGNGAALRRLLVASEPTAASVRRTLSVLAARRDEIARLVHNLGTVAEVAARNEDEIERTIRFSSDALGALAEEDEAIRDSLTRLPGTLEATSSALRHARPFAEELGPAAAELTPAIRRLTPATRALRPLVTEATPIARDRLRPFVEAGIPSLRELHPATVALRGTAAELPPVVQRLNYIVNELLYNPPGSEEGYLFWTAWFFHNAASMLSTQDAHGAAWRGLVLFSCSSLQSLTDLLPDSGVPLEVPELGELGC
jgi:phospholipid/cholesterol/gamma-HCH transport system substrate-binding protein